MLFGTTITRASILRVQEHMLENSQREGHRPINASALPDARSRCGVNLGEELLVIELEVF